MPTERLTGLLLTAAKQASDRLGFGLPAGFVPAIEPPRQASFGDYASPLALPLARAAGRPPLEIARAIAAALPPDPMIGDLSVAPPGFLNVRLSDAWLRAQVGLVLGLGEQYGRPSAPPEAHLVLGYAAPPSTVLGPDDVRLLISLSAFGRLWRYAGGSVETVGSGLSETAIALAGRLGVNFDRVDPAAPTCERLISISLKRNSEVADDVKREYRTTMVRCVRDGQPLRPVPSASQLVEEGGRDVLRFVMLQRALDEGVELDLAAARRETADNPLFYVQYACARISGLFRLAAQEGMPATPEALAGVDLQALGEPEERELLCLLAGFPDEVARAIAQLAPHRLVRYSELLATGFHRFYARCRIFADNQAAAEARLALMAATRTVLETSLNGLSGVVAPDRLDQIADAW